MRHIIFCGIAFVACGPAFGSDPFAASIDDASRVEHANTDTNDAGARDAASTDARVLVDAGVALDSGNESSAEPDAGELDANTCPSSPTLLNYCGSCPSGLYPSAVHEPFADCSYGFLFDCSVACGSRFTMCSLSAPCPAGWGQTQTVLTPACTARLRDDGTNAIVCEPLQ